MSYRNYCVISGALFALVAAVHFFRIVYGVSVRVDEVMVPMSVSWVGFIVTAGLGVWAFLLRHGASGA